MEKRGSSPMKKAKSNKKKRGVEGSPAESSKKKKIKPKGTPPSDPKSPIPSTSKAVSNSGEGNGIQTRSRALLRQK